MEALLQGLLCAANDLRRGAEAQYEAARNQDPSGVARELLRLLVSPAAQDPVRVLCAVLLRRLVTGTTSKWDDMIPDVQLAVRSTLLERMRTESSLFLRRKVCDALAELAGELLSEDENCWPEILPTLLQSVSATAAEEREMALDVFARIADPVMEHLQPQVRADRAKAAVEECVNAQAGRCGGDRATGRFGREMGEGLGKGGGGPRVWEGVGWAVILCTT